MTEHAKSSINPLLIHLSGIKTSVADAWENSFEAYLESVGIFAYFLHLNEVERLAKYPMSVRKPIPEEPAIPANPTAAVQNAYDSALKRHEKFEKLYREAREQLLFTLDDSDLDKIRAIDPISGMRSATIQVIVSWVKNMYNVITDSEISTHEKNIRAAFDYSKDLGSNLNSMKKANNILIKKGVGNSQFQMFRLAMEKLLTCDRTSKLAYEYESKPGTLELATFDALEEWIVREYGRRSKPPSSSAFAFVGDSDYLPFVKSTGLAAIPDPIHEAVGAAANGMMSISTADYEIFKRLSTDSAKKLDSKLRVAKGYCILCGHGAHGPNIGKLCFKMSTNGIPNGAFTINQLNCSSDKGGPVDNMVRSKVVMKGFKKA